MKASSPTHTSLPQLGAEMPMPMPYTPVEDEEDNDDDGDQVLTIAA
jgi:hypothetical protein